MPSSVGSKYAVALAQVNTSSVAQTPVGYLLRGNGYVKKDADTFAPRFGTGAEGLSDLDLWKTFQMTDFSGGAFQQKYFDTTMLAKVTNGVYNPYNGRLYPTKTPSSSTIPSSAGWTGAGKAVQYKGNWYMIINNVTTGGVAVLNSSTNTWSWSKSDFAVNVTDLVVANNKLWAQGASNGLWSYNGTSWANDISGASWLGTNFAYFKGKVYSDGHSSVSSGGHLYWFDPTNVANKGFVGTPGDVNRNVLGMTVYNHRIYISKQDGLYAYDGVQITTIIDNSTDSATLNFSAMTVFNGALYWANRNVLYRYNGATVERVKDFGENPYITMLATAYGRLWIGTRTADDSKSLTPTWTYQFQYYDGIGIWTYWDNPNLTDVTDAYKIPSNVIYDGTYLFFIHDGKYTAGTGQVYSYRLTAGAEFQIGTSNDITIETSEFDAGFPYIDKYCDSATLTYQDGAGGDTLTVYFRIHDGTSWGAWSSTVGGVFRRIQMRIVIHRQTSSSTLSLESFSFRYYLSPDMKREWHLTFICSGDPADNPLILLDGSEETKKAKELRDQIYQCRINDIPSIFEDIDTTTLTSQLTAGALTVNVASTAGFPPSGYLKINDELILYSSKTSTTFTVSARGRWGTTDATQANGSVVGAAYRVVITKILSERVIAPEVIDGVMNTTGNNSEITAVLKEA